MRRFTLLLAGLLLAVPALCALEVGDEAPALVFDQVNDEEGEYNLNEVSKGSFGVCFVQAEALAAQDEAMIDLVALLEALQMAADEAEEELHTLLIVVGPKEIEKDVIAAWKEHELHVPVAVLAPEQVEDWDLPEDESSVFFAVEGNKIEGIATTAEELEAMLGLEGEG